MQDYINTPDNEKPAFIQTSIETYRQSPFYKMVIEGEAYFNGENTSIITKSKNIVKLSNGREIPPPEAVTSNIFRQLIIQQNALLLSNGAQITAEIEKVEGESEIPTDEKGKDLKPKFGVGFDNTLSQLGEAALRHSISYGYWDYDRLTMFTALEFFTLDDERSGEPQVGVRFWDRHTFNNGTVTFIEFYEINGVTEFKIQDGLIELTREKVPYGKSIRPLTNETVGITVYPSLPIVQFWGNYEQTSELTKSIKSKIDMLDEVWTNFGGSLSRINLMYWVIKNYNVSTDEAYEMISEIKRLGIISEQDKDFTAEPKTFELPSAAVDNAVNIIRNAIISDFMGVDLKEISGGSLTNVAINTAFSNLLNKVSRFTWMPFNFIQQLMIIIGLQPTENIQFKLDVPRNFKEETEMVLSAKSELDEKTILEKLPWVMVDEVQVILDRKSWEIKKTPPLKETIEEEIIE